VHCAIDDHTRLAYAEIHPDERAPFVDATMPDGSRLHVVIPDITYA
jgi:Flp pilus assembly CpaF family ATPase